MVGWTQIALLTLISLWGSTWVSDMASVEAVPVCIWCHPEDEPVEPAARGSVMFLQQADTAEFTHELHLPVNCESCHVSLQTPNPRDYAWCDQCHHRPQPPDACARCHDTGPDPNRRFSLTFQLPGGAEDRPTGFPHEAHRDVQECDACHGTPPGPVEGDFECASCHTEHHEAETVDCVGCHEPPPTWAHEDVVVHQTCAGGVCHKAFEPGPTTAWPRSTCEACHRDFVGVEPLPAVPEHLRPDTSATPSVGSSPTRPSV